MADIPKISVSRVEGTNQVKVWFELQSPANPALEEPDVLNQLTPFAQEHCTNYVLKGSKAQYQKLTDNVRAAFVQETYEDTTRWALKFFCVKK